MKKVSLIAMANAVNFIMGKGTISYDLISYRDVQEILGGLKKDVPIEFYLRIAGYRNSKILNPDKALSLLERFIEEDLGDSIKATRLKIDLGKLPFQGLYDNTIRVKGKSTSAILFFRT